MHTEKKNSLFICYICSNTNNFADATFFGFCYYSYYLSSLSSNSTLSLPKHKVIQQPQIIIIYPCVDERQAFLTPSSIPHDLHALQKRIMLLWTLWSRRKINIKNISQSKRTICDVMLRECFHGPWRTEEEIKLSNAQFYFVFIFFF